MRAALEQDGGDAGGAEQQQRRGYAVGLVGAGGDDDVGAGGLQRVGRRARRRARDHDGQRDLGRPCARGSSSPAGVRWCRRRCGGAGAAASGSRAVSWGSSRSAVPMPTATASQPARQRWPSSRLAADGDPLGVAGLGGDLAVEGHGRLEQHPRAPRARVLAEGLVELARAGGELALGHDDLDAVVAQDPQAPAGGLLGGVVGGDDHAADAGRAIASVHGGVRPSWQQGSSETYIVAPLRSVSPASAIAATSACGPPSIACQPSPTTSPSLTTTAPASGLGET